MKLRRFVIFLIVLLGVFVYLLKWNSNYVVPQSKISLQSIDKLRGTQLKGGAINLSSDELNEIISMYFKGQKNSGPLLINGIKAELLGDKIKLNMPCNYKGFNIFVSSDGKLSLKDDKIIYSVEEIKVGKVPLPKSYVMNEIKKYKIKGLTVEDNQVSFHKNLIPLGIKAIEIKDSRLSIYIEKINLEERIKSLIKR